MFLKKRYMWIVIGIMHCYAHASEVDILLNEYNNKNALSQKTIDENKGHLVLYTRDKLERMHAKTMKDVFKTTPVLYYHENRYGRPDPLTSGAFEPYRSDFIRLYIDGVEATQGWMGSGIALYGDMNIDFVDHIEFYYNIPSFETSSEPAYLTIFLYSKEANRDKGGKVSILGGSRGYNAQTISYGEQKQDFSYMVNLSHTDAKREKIANGTTRPLSRDFERIQLFSYIKSENQIFHLQIMKKNTDSLAGLSLDATPLISEMDYLNLHIDYGIALSEHWKSQFTYEHLDSDIKQEDDKPFLFDKIPLANKLYIKGENRTFTGELTYKDKIGKHHITTGIKDRIKTIDSFSIKNLGELDMPFDNENIFSLFFQDQYNLDDNQLLTAGIEYSYISRNGGVSDEKLLQVRLGYLYLGEKWSYKTYLYRTMFALNPFEVYQYLKAKNSIDSQITKGITQEIGYTGENFHIRLITSYMKDENGLLENNHKGNTKYLTSIFNYAYEFDIDNKMALQLYYSRYEDIINVDELEDFSGYLSFSNIYNKWSFYNGVVWHQNSLNHKNYFDLTSSASWDINKNITLTLKADNLLNKAKETNLFRADPNTGALLDPLSISPIDQRITFEIEYRF